MDSSTISVTDEIQATMNTQKQSTQKGIQSVKVKNLVYPLNKLIFTWGATAPWTAMRGATWVQHQQQ